MGKLVEGLWDCPYCDTTSIKASQKTCPNCGHPQDENTVFRMPDTISYVSDEDAAKISQNPDWQCSFCGSLNKDIDNSCNNCGASKEESEKNYFEMRRERDEKSNKKQNMAVKAINKSSDNCISKSKGDNVILESLLTSIAIIAITASIILGIWVISCLTPRVRMSRLMILIGNGQLILKKLSRIMRAAGLFPVARGSNTRGGKPKHTNRFSITTRQCRKPKQGRFSTIMKRKTLTKTLEMDISNKRPTGFRCTKRRRTPKMYKSPSTGRSQCMLRSITTR